MSPVSIDLTEKKRALLELLLRERGVAPVRDHRIPRRPAGSPVPLSFQQGRLWFLDRLQPGESVYNIPLVLRLDGPLHRPALRAALGEIERRHEVLRTRFPGLDGRPAPEIDLPRQREVPEVDLGALPAGLRETAAVGLAAEVAARPFDLERGPVWTALVLRLEEREHWLAVTLHHLVADGDSVSVLLREIAALYPSLRDGVLSPLPELPLQYADYALWQRERLAGAELDRLLGYWRRVFAGYEPLLDLPTDRPRPAVQTFEGDTCSAFLPDPLAARLRSFATASGATPFMVLLTAFAALLARWCGREDLALGTPVSQRTRKELEELIGFFANTLVLRLRVSGGMTFATALAAVRETSLAASAHQEMPFDRLVEDLQPERSLSVSPLFQVLFSFQTDEAGCWTLPGLEAALVPLPGSTVKTELGMSVVDSPRGVSVAVDYNTGLFDRTTALRLLDQLVRLLQTVLAAPGERLEDLSWLAAAERHQLLVEWNDTRQDFPAGACLHELFETQADRVPGALAVAARAGSVTYGELERRANALARALIASGILPGDRVAVCLRRTPDLVASLLGVLKTGAAYVPLDPEYPEERLGFMLADSRAAAVLSEAALRECLPASGRPVLLLEEIGAEPGLPPGRPEGRASAGGLAYVIYTSGSTGRPKGVALRHRGAVALLSWAREVFAPADTAAVLASTSVCFDLSVFELFLPLALGHTAVLADNALDLAERPPQIAPTLINTVPSAMAELIRLGAVPASVRAVNLAGEPLPAVLVEEIGRRTVAQRVCNLYGPSEDTTYSTFAFAGPGREGAPPIGRPVANASAYLLDRGFQPVSIGARGEIWLGGEGLAMGYFDRPDLTAERFLPNPFSGPGERLYRTGDLARRRPDGALEFLGRIDHQVKIRGFRIEPGEIEAALCRHPLVGEAAVLVREEARGSQNLVACVTPRGGRRPDGQEIREALAARLPSFLVPGVVLVLEALPLTPNGKLDRKELLRLVSQERSPEGLRAAPRTPAETTLAGIWSEILGREVGIHDNFFELGGDSILSLQIVSRANRAGLHLTAKHVFQHQTVAQLAAVAGGAPVKRSAGAAEAGPVPLTPVQRWFFGLGLADPHHFNQAVSVALPQAPAPSVLSAALGALAGHHDALRLRFHRGPDGGVRAEIPPATAPPPLLEIDLAALSPDRHEEVSLEAAGQVQGSLDPEAGPVMRAALFRRGGGEAPRLLLAAHHLVVDAVSWRILLEDLGLLASHGGPAPLPEVPTSWRAWASRLEEAGVAPAWRAEAEAWALRNAGPVAPLPLDHPGGRNTFGSAREVQTALEAEEAEALFREVTATYRVRAHEVVLAAVVQALGDWTGSGAVALDLEAHGREEVLPGTDLSRTVGWFTALLPARFEADAADCGATLLRVKETARAASRGGFALGLVGSPGLPRPEVSFNFLGTLDAGWTAGPLGAPRFDGPVGPLHSPRQERPYRLDVTAWVSGGRLHLSFSYSESLHRRETVEDLARSAVAHLRALHAHGRAVEAVPWTPSDFPLARLDAGVLERSLGTDRTVEDVYPLSPLQRGLLFHVLFAPGSLAYVEQIRLRLRGPLNPEAFVGAWRAVVARHAVLRTRFLWQDLPEPLQVVHRGAEVQIAVHSEEGLASESREALWRSVCEADLRDGFELDRGPLLRLSLVGFGREEWAFAWTFPHLLLDGWSLPIVLSEVFAFYEHRGGAAPGLPAVRPYRDYIAWLGELDLARAEAFWKEELAGIMAPTPLPADRPPALFEASTPFGQRTAELPAGVTEALRALARRHHVTLNIVLQGAWALLLGRFAGEDEAVFGATVSGRPAELPDVESMVGLFINTLPVRTALPPEILLPDWWGELQARFLELRQHEHTPLHQVQRWSAVPAGAPLFESLVVFENYPVAEALDRRDPGVHVEHFEVAESAEYPLTLALGPSEALLLRLQHDPRRFEAVTAARLLEHLLTLLADLALHPDKRLGEVDLLTPAQLHQVRTEWNDIPSSEGPSEDLLRVFERRAAEAPDAIAVEGPAPGETRTYGELDRDAGRLARALAVHGVGPETPVAVLLERSAASVVSLLAILKAGGVYLPLDPAYPPDRLAWLLEDARPAVLLTDLAPSPSWSSPVLDPTRLLDGDGEPSRRPGADPRQLCYTIYTSGSTGRPKGVVATRGNLTGFLFTAIERLGLAPGDRVASLASVAFDISLFEMLAPLMIGGRTVLLPSGSAVSLADLDAAVSRVDVLHAVPALLRELIDRRRAGPAGGGSPRLVLTGGDAVPPDLPEAAREAFPGAAVHVLYGPTETTVLATSWRSGPERPSLGRPFPGVHVEVRDTRCRAVPVGAVGEIWISGRGVTRGYLRRPELTAERFVPHPGGRSYRSGDLGRWRPDGRLEFVGRNDGQVKIRGVRVEPGEVEATLRRHPGVREAVVAARGQETGRHLVAWWVAAGGPAPEAFELRELLRERLPEAYVPSAWVRLEALPLNVHGKVDRSALPDPAAAAPAAPSAAAESETEQRVAALWSAVLGVERIGLHDNFFDLGGHSLHLLRVHDQLRSAFAVELPVVDLFRHPTVRSLSERLAELRGESGAAPAAAPSSRRGEDRGASRRVALARRQEARLKTPADWSQE